MFKKSFKKGIAVTLAALTLLLTMSTTVFASDVSKDTKTNTTATSNSDKAPKVERVKLNIDGKEVVALHKEAPEPTVTSQDVGAGWTESYSTFTSSHFQALIYTGIADVLAYKFGGTRTFWLTLSATFAGGYYNEFTGDDYQDVHYYYQYNGTDPVFPYYVKQFIVHYRDSAQTQYVGTSTRYYYSSMPY